MIDFTGQVVIVTGAGRGLGRLYALDLARRGASVVVNDVGGSMDGEGSDSSVADHVSKEIRGEGGVAVASHDSVATAEGGEAIVHKAMEHFGRVDAVVSNAGIFDTLPFDELPTENWRRMLNVHLDGSFYLSQPAYRVMKGQGSGRFVFIASSAGLSANPTRRTTQRPKRASWAWRMSSPSTALPTASCRTPSCPSATPGWSLRRWAIEMSSETKCHSFGRSNRNWWCLWSSSWQAGHAPSRTRTTPPAQGASPGSSSDWARAGSHLPHATDGRGDRGTSGRGGGYGAVHRARLDLRRSGADLFSAWDSVVAESPLALFSNGVGPAPYTGWVGHLMARVADNCLLAANGFSGDAGVRTSLFALVGKCQ